MTYVFEKVTDEIREKIFADVKEDCIRKKIPKGRGCIHLAVQKNLNGEYIGLSNNWAIDCDKNYYLLRVRGRMAPDKCYLFYYNDECYELAGNPRYPQGLSISDVNHSSLEQSFFDEVDAAFLVYGHTGAGNEYPMISITEKHLPIIKRG